MRIPTAISVLLLVILGPAVPAWADDPLILEPPVPGAVVRLFTAGPQPWSPGHRGVDLAARASDRVHAAAAGVVHFAGSVAGRPSVSIDHGNGLRTTYTPVRASVSEGEGVRAGDVIGAVVAGHCPGGCLHWGLTDGVDYFDPLAHLTTRPVRLLPIGSVAADIPRFRAAAPGLPAGGLPVTGPITSRFGMRTHPVTGVHKLHDGTDIAAACGTPVLAPWAGTVTLVERHPAYGIRVIVEHLGGRSGYAHLQRASVAEGQAVTVGSILGAVGDTGLSTGCHLHWMTWDGERLRDPLRPGGAPAGTPPGDAER